MIPEAMNRLSSFERAAETYAVKSYTLPASIKKVLPQDDSPTALKHSRRNILFQSQVMKEAMQLAEKYAKSHASVLVTGESGTGKELFSRLIHERSPRSNEEFVAVNCAAISESLIESELFGHEKGAFTDAGNSKIGYFEAANGGTLLLDEITEIPLRIQAKLLRVLEEKEIHPVGSCKPRPINVRVIATSNRDVAEEVKVNRFRGDLYHRLNILDLKIPPLRERRTDIPVLASQFVRRFAQEFQCSVDRIDSESMKRLCEYAWPGNVRELRNVLERACVVASGTTVTPDLLPAQILNPTDESSAESIEGKTIAEIERMVIIKSLKKHAGNKRIAADELGVTARTLTNKLKLYQSDGTCDITFDDSQDSQ